MDAARARRLLQYDCNTGRFTWKERSPDMFSAKNPIRAAGVWNTRYAGSVAGTINRWGYRIIAIDSVLYRAARLAWLIHIGGWPNDVIDHINGDRADDRIANLRDISISENSRNQRRSSKNTSGVTGVIWDCKTQKWRAQIVVGGTCQYLGQYERQREAVAVRKKAERDFNFHPNHGRA